jgi:thiol-disulfide isomerase/thioredoxin
MKNKISQTVMMITLALLIFLPSFSAQTDNLLTLADKPVTYKDLVSSPNTILFVWTTWCPYCVRELKSVTSQKVSFEGIELYFVNIGEKKSTVERFLNSQKIPQSSREKVIIDIKGIIAEKFSITGIPAYIFLKKGKIAHRSFFLDQSLVDNVFDE